MDIKHIARLARLHVSETEAKTYESQLGSILEYVDKLQELNTDQVPELQHAIDVTNVFREDIPEGCDPNVRERALENFSNRKEYLLQVPGVFLSVNE